jgi:aminopeptidase
MLESSKKIRIIGQQTDISFSIKWMNVIKWDGRHNIPDGEVYVAPVKESVNWRITYNIPSEYLWTYFDHVFLEVENGKIIHASSNENKKINDLLDTDAWSRFFWEFALWLNPFITKPSWDRLFDEKIAGSFHLTPGDSYKDSFNGNMSSIHWDLVNIQTEEYWWGEIWFDNILIRKNGLFVIPELEDLNPINLI